MEEKPNIVLVVLDSTREDFIPEFQDIKTFDPLLEWASDGVRYTKAHAHSITSASSMGSLLTGLHPHRHALRPADSSLPDSVRTVAERLSTVGYRTIGVSANIHFSDHTGLDRGFNDMQLLTSNPRQAIEALDASDLFKFILQIRTESAGFEFETQKHTVTPLLNSIIKRQLTDIREPFFIAIQYIEPHSPYYPPRKCLEEDDSVLADIAYEIHDRMYEIQAAGTQLSDQEIHALKRMYALEIAYSASKIIEVLRYISQSTSKQIIFIITADHGDLFGEQEFLFHSRPLHDKLTHVPLLTKGLPVKSESGMGATYRKPVLHADIMKTVLNITEADSEGIDGIDLRHENRERFITQRPYSFDWEILQQHNPDYKNEYIHSGPVTAFHIDDYKIKISPDKRSVYNIAADPSEQSAKNLDEIPNAVRSRFEEWRYELDKSGVLTPRSTKQVTMDEATKDKLRKLGYY